MYCKQCGKKIDDNSQFCVYCGTPVRNPGQSTGEDDYFSDDPGASYSQQNNGQYNQQYGPQYGPPPQYGPYPYGQQEDNWTPTGKNTWGVLGFILALASIFFGFSFIVSIAALVVSIVGMTKRKQCTKYNGFAVAGIVISILTILLWVLFWVMIILLGEGIPMP